MSGISANGFERALREGRETLMAFLQQGDSITLKIEEAPSGINSALPYRYDSTDTLSLRFLLRADPNVSGLAEALVVDQILTQVKSEGYTVRRNKKRVVIKPK